MTSIARAAALYFELEMSPEHVPLPQRSSAPAKLIADRQAILRSGGTLATAPAAKSKTALVNAVTPGTKQTSGIDCGRLSLAFVLLPSC